MKMGSVLIALTVNTFKNTSSFVEEISVVGIALLILLSCGERERNVTSKIAVEEQKEKDLITTDR